MCVEDALSYVGMTVVNDVSMRDWQGRTSEWLRQQELRGLDPVGPVLVTVDELDDPLDLAISCEVDGGDHAAGQDLRAPVRTRRTGVVRLHVHHPAPRRPHREQELPKGWRSPAPASRTCAMVAGHDDDRRRRLLPQPVLRRARSPTAAARHVMKAVRAAGAAPGERGRRPAPVAGPGEVTIRIDATGLCGSRTCPPGWAITHSPAACRARARGGRHRGRRRLGRDKHRAGDAGGPVPADRMRRCASSIAARKICA